MIVIDPGHQYSLKTLDGFNLQYLTFVKREGPGYPGNEGSYPGTTTQDVLRVLIDRTKYVDAQIHDHRNDEVIHHLRMAIFYLEARAAYRHDRLEEFSRLIAGHTAEIEFLPTCEKCNHIGCPGTCH